jgi:flagellar secretion chaperone FliS
MSLAARAAYRQVTVETASPIAVVVMLYERLTRDISEAELAIVDRRFDVVNHALNHAQDIVVALKTSLDTSKWAEGQSLVRLYDWFSEQLVEANLTKNPALLAPVKRMVSELADTWRAAAAGSADAVVSL